MVSVALLCILLDYISAFILCFSTGKLNSSVGRKGVAGKLMYFLLIFIGYLLDYLLKTDYVMSGVCIFVIANELVSILENAGRIPGVKVPDVLKNAIEVLKNKGERK
jgi:toxin secretion/phage lysis holin